MFSFIEPCSISENDRDRIRKGYALLIFLIRKREESRRRETRIGPMYEGDNAISISSPS